MASFDDRKGQAQAAFREAVNKKLDTKHDQSTQGRGDNTQHAGKQDGVKIDSKDGFGQAAKGATSQASHEKGSKLHNAAINKNSNNLSK